MIVPGSCSNAHLPVPTRYGGVGAGDAEAAADGEAEGRKGVAVDVIDGAGAVARTSGEALVGDTGRDGATSPHDAQAATVKTPTPSRRCSFIAEVTSLRSA
jgi:hypothetical protein